jgi:patatin-like phospholipase/acyl hydrolase
MTRILSIDGGGIRGLIPVMVLTEIGKLTQKPIVKLFDVIAGTSTGGILACGLCVPDSAGEPIFSASALVDLYLHEGPRIFPYHVFERLTEHFEAKYPASGIEQVLHEYFGELRPSEALTELFVTAYDIERRKPKFFRTKDARQNPAKTICCG